VSFKLICGAKKITFKTCRQVKIQVGVVYGTSSPSPNQMVKKKVKKKTKKKVGGREATKRSKVSKVKKLIKLAKSKTKKRR
jgi:hypothetical protein